MATQLFTIFLHLLNVFSIFKLLLGVASYIQYNFNWRLTKKDIYNKMDLIPHEVTTV